MTASLKRTGLLAIQVFREAMRDRVWYATGAFAVVMAVAVVLIADITAGQEVKIVKDAGLALIELTAVGTAALLGVGLISRDVERRSIFLLLSKPVARWEIVLGKFGGLLLTMGANLVAMTIVLYLALIVMTVQLSPGARMALEAPAVDPRLSLVALAIGAEAALLAAVAVFFSTFSSSTLVSVGFTAGVYIVGLLSGELRSMGEIAEVSPAVAHLARGAGWIAPAFSAFDIKAQVVHGLDIPFTFFVSTTTYAVLYVAALLAAAVAVFERREFA